jgi:hypothetical protein
MGENEALKTDPFAGRMPEEIGDFHPPLTDAMASI